MTPIEFIHNYCNWSNPNWVWMLVGMSRNKDNKEKDDIHHTPERFMRRLVIRKPEEIQDCYDELRKMGNSLGTTYRMYLSLNSRDVVSTFFHFQQELAKVGYGLARQLPDALALSKKIASEWKTELAQNRNRGTKRILIDVDEDDEFLVQQLMASLGGLKERFGVNVYACKKTVSGYAISCDAHDIRWVKEQFGKRNIEIKRDSLIFVEQWEGEEV